MCVILGSVSTMSSSQWRHMGADRRHLKSPAIDWLINSLFKLTQTKQNKIIKAPVRGIYRWPTDSFDKGSTIRKRNNVTMSLELYYFSIHGIKTFLPASFQTNCVRATLVPLIIISRVDGEDIDPDSEPHSEWEKRKENIFHWCGR